MRLLYHDDGEFCLTKDLSDQIPPYAILSHRWGNDEAEVKFQELTNPTKTKSGYKKLQLCGQQAQKDGLAHFWVDTCCIDKTSTAELDKNINSMFRYYRDAAKCYVYLSDVCSSTDLEKSEWFRRGWTLQELLAPRHVKFYSQNWEYIGDKLSLQDRIQSITGIPAEALSGNLSNFSKDERLRWIQDRKTTEKEDKAYCLFGIFNVSMSLRYGEGEEAAFKRLENKIRKSSKPTLQTVDNSVRDYYLSAGRLHIQRLSGQCLPMESCFINLGIIDNHEEGRFGMESNEGALTLAAHVQAETPEKSKQVTLKTLFDPRMLAQGGNGRPKRILIWGRAGIGKTTLCKKMVHDFYCHDLWQDLYDRVFWLPLRRLKSLRDETKSIAEIIEKTCFHGANDGLFPPELLHDMLGSRCLFILDGLDEVSSAFDPDSSMGANLNKLLGQRDVIITSRPHSTTILSHIPPDLRLQTVGFFPAQLDEYLHQDGYLLPDQISQIQTFIKNRPTMKSLVRIPIQLDAVCYVWGMEHFQHDIVTMTALYQAVSDCLWKKDVIRLDIKCKGHPVLPQQINFHTNVRILVEHEAVCLEKLAFTGLLHQIVEFGLKMINDTATIPDLHLIDKVCKSSFLRSSDDLVTPDHQTHHFIHLTYQEFFAARYFVSCFTSCRKIEIPETVIVSGQLSKNKEVDTAAFIRQMKYDTRFDNFWRFVAGLLSLSGNEHLDEFFRKLEDGPLDLLGRTHQRLTSHCLNEVDQTWANFSDKAHELAHNYEKWTQFKLRVCETDVLLSAPECPTRVLRHWLEGTEVERIAVMKSLSKGSDIRFDVSDMIIEQALRHGHSASRDYALALIAVHYDQFSEKDPSLNTLVTRNTTMWLEATERAKVLTSRRSRAFIEAASLLVQEADYHSQRLALRSLRYQSDLSKSTINIITQMLGNRNADIRDLAADVLKNQEKSSKSGGENSHQSFRKARSNMWSLEDKLSEHKSLPEPELKSVFRELKGYRGSIWITAMSFFWYQEEVPASIIVDLIQLLQDKDRITEIAVTVILSNLPSLSGPHCQQIIGLLKSRRGATYAAYVLYSRTNFGQLILNLDSRSLQGLLRGLLEDSYFFRSGSNVVTLYDNELFVRVNGKTWTVAVEAAQQERFEEQWVQAQKAIGVPLSNND